MLKEFVANDNKIINIDINQNTNLTKLILNNNALERVYLRNGNNANITEFDITGNPDLVCIAVDDVDFANTNWSQKDATATYNTDCNSEWEVYTTDENLDTALNSIPGIDDDGDGAVTYEEAQAFTGDLDLSGTPIEKLPDNLKVGGSLDLDNTPIERLPDNLQVGGGLYLDNTPIKELPDNLQVGGILFLTGTPIKELPDNLQVGGNLFLVGTPIEKLPDNLQVSGSLFLQRTPLSKKYSEEEIRNMIEEKGGYVKRNIIL